MLLGRILVPSRSKGFEALTRIPVVGAGSRSPATASGQDGTAYLRGNRCYDQILRTFDA